MASTPNDLPRVGELRDGGFVVTVNTETLEYTVRRFADEPERSARGP